MFNTFPHLCNKFKYYYFIKDKQEKPSYQIPKPQGRQPTGPEEDVLYQWRLKRKVEQARDNASKTPAVKFGYKDKAPGQVGQG